MAHVAYELARNVEGKPNIGNEQLLSEVRWILELLGDHDVVLSQELQKGLVGECVLLRRLLLLAQALRVPPRAVLQTWVGFDRAKRDFAGHGIAIEVKTTSSDTRIHHIGSLAQLEAQEGEEVYVYSVCTKSDASGPKKLPDFVAEVSELLLTSDGRQDPDLIAHFEECLGKYGYRREQDNIYRASPGFLNFHLPPRLFRERELDRVRLSSFKEERLPAMVVDITYRLEMRSAELGQDEERAVLSAMLGRSGMTM